MNERSTPQSTAKAAILNEVFMRFARGWNRPFPRARPATLCSGARERASTCVGARESGTMTEAERDERAASQATIVNARGPWPFVTEWQLKDASGHALVRESRRNRKGLEAVPNDTAQRSR